MFRAKYTKKELRKKIKLLEDFLGPRVNYNSNPKRDIFLMDKWLLKDLFELKEEYYKKVKKNEKFIQNQRSPYTTMEIQDFLWRLFWVANLFVWLLLIVYGGIGFLSH